jgi:uncharacterized metal-binding protein
MAENAKDCACGTAPKLVFACSGAADVGEIADRTARALAKEGAGKMYCLAGIGGRVGSIVVNAQAAGKILAIDGCPLNCARRTLEEAGFGSFAHMQLGDIGLAKGASPATDERVALAVEQAKTLLAC